MLQEINVVYIKKEKAAECKVQASRTYRQNNRISEDTNSLHIEGDFSICLTVLTKEETRCTMYVSYVGIDLRNISCNVNINLPRIRGLPWRGSIRFISILREIRLNDSSRTRENPYRQPGLTGQTLLRFRAEIRSSRRKVYRPAITRYVPPFIRNDLLLKTNIELLDIHMTHAVCARHIEYRDRLRGFAIDINNTSVSFTREDLILPSVVENIRYVLKMRRASRKS